MPEILDLSNDPALSIITANDEGDLYTNSLRIAEKFGKRHKNVLQRIEALPRDEFWRLNFQPTSYGDSQGKTQPIYNVTRDGFSLLAMGFTGQKAYEWKVKFINAFNMMEKLLRKELRRQVRQAKKEWQENRTAAALEYRLMSRTLEEVRSLHGKETKFYHYANEAKLVNWSLTGEYKALDREALSRRDLGILITLEAYNAVLLGAGLDREERKARLRQRCQLAVQDLMQLN